LNYSAITQENDVEFAKRLTIENKVASIPISLFYENRRQDHLLRFCFAKEREDLEAGAERLHNFK
jgi:methionine aminotransferase